MKLLFCVNRDIYANIALNHLFPALSPTGKRPENELKVLFSESVAGTRAHGAALTYLRFYEQDLLNEFLFPQLESTSPNQSPGSLLTFNQLSQRYAAPMRLIDSIHAPDVLTEIGEFAPDLIISIRFGHIFKAPLLQIPRLGILNLHSGLLPQYRGILATFWSLLHQRSEYGFTLHTVTDGTIDTGAIVDRRAFPVKAGQSLFEHTIALYEPAAASILQALECYRNGQSPPTLPQVEADSHYYSLPTPEDFERLIALGFPILNREAYYQCLTQYQSSPNPVLA
jgi:methionyl-tRNA formyltransferase